MRIPDAAWRELRAAYEAVDERYSALAGLLGVSEKTATAWLEDRSREVRQSHFDKAMRTLRERATRRNVRTDTDNSETAGGSSKSVAPSPRVSHPDAATEDPSVHEGARKMTLNDDQYWVFRTWEEDGPEAAMRKLAKLVGHPAKAEPHARRHLQRGKREA